MKRDRSKDMKEQLFRHSKNVLLDLTRLENKIRFNRFHNIYTLRIVTRDRQRGRVITGVIAIKILTR